MTLLAREFWCKGAACERGRHVLNRAHVGTKFHPPRRFEELMLPLTSGVKAQRAQGTLRR